VNYAELNIMRHDKTVSSSAYMLYSLTGVPATVTERLLSCESTERDGDRAELGEVASPLNNVLSDLGATTQYHSVPNQSINGVYSAGIISISRYGSPFMAGNDIVQ